MAHEPVRHGQLGEEMATYKVRVRSSGEWFDSSVEGLDGRPLHLVQSVDVSLRVGEPVRATMTVLQPELDVTLELVDKAQYEAALARIAELERLCETRRAYNVSLVWEIEQLRAGTLPSGEGGEVKPPEGFWQEPVDFGAGPLTPEEVARIVSKKGGEVRVNVTGSVYGDEALREAIRQEIGTAVKQATCEKGSEVQNLTCVDCARHAEEKGEGCRCLAHRDEHATGCPESCAAGYCDNAAEHCPSFVNIARRPPPPPANKPLATGGGYRADEKGAA